MGVSNSLRQKAAVTARSERRKWGSHRSLLTTKGNFIYNSTVDLGILTLRFLLSALLQWYAAIWFTDREQHNPHKKVLISLWQELGFSLSAFASNCSDLLTIPSSHLPNYYFSVAPCAPSSCDPIFSLAEVSKRSGAMTRDLFLNSGNLCMILRAERNNQGPQLPQRCSWARDLLRAKWNRTTVLKPLVSYASQSLAQHSKSVYFCCTGLTLTTKGFFSMGQHQIVSTH